MHVERQHGIAHVTIDHKDGAENATLTITTPGFVHPRTGQYSEDRVQSISLPVSIWEWVTKNLPSPPFDTGFVSVSPSAPTKVSEVERRHLLDPMIELYGRQPEGTKIDAEEVVALLNFIKGDS